MVWELYFWHLFDMSFSKALTYLLIGMAFGKALQLHTLVPFDSVFEITSTCSTADGHWLATHVSCASFIRSVYIRNVFRLYAYIMGWL